MKSNSRPGKASLESIECSGPPIRSAPPPGAGPALPAAPPPPRRPVGRRQEHPVSTAVGRFLPLSPDERSTAGREEGAGRLRRSPSCSLGDSFRSVVHPCLFVLFSLAVTAQVVIQSAQIGHGFSQISRIDTDFSNHVFRADPFHACDPCPLRAGLGSYAWRLKSRRHLRSLPAQARSQSPKGDLARGGAGSTAVCGARAAPQAMTCWMAGISNSLSPAYVPRQRDSWARSHALARRRRVPLLGRGASARGGLVPTR